MPHSEHSFAEIEFGGGSVKKIFKRPDACDHVAHLFNIYRHLKAKSVPHSDFLKATSIKPGDCSITTSPVGDSRWPKDSRELHTALVCILSALEVLAVQCYGWPLTSCLESTC